MTSYINSFFSGIRSGFRSLAQKPIVRTITSAVAAISLTGACYCSSLPLAVAGIAAGAARYQASRITQQVRTSNLRRFRTEVCSTAEGAGICHGHMLRRMSRQDNDFQGARFIQAAYGLESPAQDLQALGKTVLASPSKFRFTLSRASQILRQPVQTLRERQMFRAIGATALSQHSDQSQLTHLIQKKSLLIAKMTRTINALEEKKRNGTASERELEKLRVITKKLKRAYSSLDRLRQEKTDLGQSISTAAAAPDDRVPDPVMRRLGLRKGQTIVDETPLTQLSSSLSAMRGKRGSFEFALHGGRGNHSIYMTSYPSFTLCDINDIDLSRGIEPRTRTFNSLEEMNTFLRGYLSLMYPQHTDFSITEYERVV